MDSNLLFKCKFVAYGRKYWTKDCRGIYWECMKREGCVAVLVISLIYFYTT